MIEKVRSVLYLESREIKLFWGKMRSLKLEKGLL